MYVNSGVRERAFNLRISALAAGAVFPTGGIGGRLGRHSEGGAKNCAQQKKKKKRIGVFFFAGQSFFCAPFYISNQYFDIKKNLTLG